MRIDHFFCEENFLFNNRIASLSITSILSNKSNETFLLDASSHNLIFAKTVGQSREIKVPPNGSRFKICPINLQSSNASSFCSKIIKTSPSS